MQTSDTVQVHRLNEGDKNIDLKKILLKLVDKWHWFLISIVICLLVAFLYSRYSAPMYVINSRVLIKDDDGGGGLGKQAGALMDLGGLMGPQSSVDNEAEILKTPDLMDRVVREMNLNVVYKVKSNFVSREIYKAPFKLNIIKGVDTIESSTIEINKVSNDRMRVIAKDFDQEVKWNQNFVVNGIGTLQLVPTLGVLLNDADYYVNVTSVDQRVIELMNQTAISLSNNKATIVDLSMTYPVQKKGEEILNKLIETYQKTNLADKNAIADSTYTFIEERLTGIATELGDVETKVERFKQQNRLSDMTEQGKLLVQTTGEFTSELAKTETQVSVLSDLEEYLKDETKNKRVFPTALLPSDLVFSNLMTQYNTLLADRDRTLMSVTAETPFVKNLDAQIASLRAGILANIQSTKNTFVITRNKLRSQLAQAQSEIKDVPQIEKNYLQLARNQEIKQELYIFLMQKAEETAISKNSTISIAKIIRAPKSEFYPLSPRKGVIYFFGFLIGLILPAAVVYGRDLFNTSINTKDDITSLTRIPIVGEISHNATADNLIVSSNGRSVIAEQFRALRSNLSFYAKNKEQKVILITSSMSGEGKSFTALNLSNVLALLGKRVLLMEMDLRKPGLSNKLNIANDLGFSNYIVDDKLQIADIVKPTTLNPNLFVITSGPLPPNPAELLLDDRSIFLFTELEKQFDYIIMDAPPVGLVSDAESLSRYAFITLYVVRQKITQKQQLNVLNELVASNKISNLGIVVNDVVSKDYGYGNGYGTYGEAKG